MKTATWWRFWPSYDPDSRGGDPADGRKVKGATIHWVDAAHCRATRRCRLYDNLFNDPDPDAGGQGFSGLPESRSLWKSSPAARWRPACRDAKAPASYPVHASGLLLPGQQGLRPRPSGVQPFRQPEGFLQARKVIPHSIENPAAISGSYQTVNRHGGIIRCACYCIMYH